MRTKAFTLIELAVVLLVVGILAGIVLRNIGSQGIQARDVKRLGDLRNINVYLSQYMSKVGQFPTMSDINWTDNVGLEAELKAKNVISTALPTASPSGGSNYEYYTCSDQGSQPPTGLANHFVLRVKLEQTKTENPQVYEGTGTIPAGWKCADATGNVLPALDCDTNIKNYCLIN